MDPIEILMKALPHIVPSPSLLSSFPLALTLITYTYTQNALKQMHKILHNIAPILTPKSHLISQAKNNAYFLKEEQKISKLYKWKYQ